MDFQCSFFSHHLLLMQKKKKKKGRMTKKKILIWSNQIHILFLSEYFLKLYLVLVISVQIHCDQIETRLS